MIKKCAYTFRQENKHFYNYTLYMTVSVFNKYSFDNYEHNNTPIHNNRYNGRILFQIFSRYYPYNL